MAANKGQALIELVLAIAIAVMLLAALTTGVIAAREGFARTGKIGEANILLQKEIEAIRSVRETAWNSISNPDTYHTEQSGNSWIAVSGTIMENGFTRGFTVANVCRSGSNSSIISCGSPQAVNDPSTKEIATNVSWSFLGTQSVSSTFYLTRYSGNQAWTQTTLNDFNDGTFNNTESTNDGGGAVRLIVKGGQSFIDEYTNSSDYTFDPNKIEVTGGFAQLKAQGSTVSGSTTNSGFDTNANGWSWSSWGQDIGQGRNYRSTGGNPGGYVDISASANNNKNGGGYWSQPFTTTVANPTTNVRLDWRITAYQSPPTSFRLYVFVDPNNSAPNIGQEVWRQNITGTTNWASVVNIDASSRVTTARTYYLKVAMYIQRPRGQYAIGFDNVQLNWSKTVGGGYPTDQPNIYRVVSFSAPSITSWTSFTQTAVLNGGSIMYQLSDNDGSTWRYFNGATWVIATLPTHYNNAATLNSNISTFPTTNNKINVRAFLISNGSQFVRLDQIVIGYQGSETGTYISTTFNTTLSVGFNRILWTESSTANTTIKFQVATNNDNNTWNFVGPDGTPSTYFVGSSGIIPLGIVAGQYLKYKIYFSSNTNDIPIVYDVTINYSP